MPSQTESCCARSRKEEQKEVSVYKTQGPVVNETGHGRGQLDASMMLLVLLLIKQSEEHFY
jgi:hypothetical protein